MPKISFTVSARAARLIGQENFSNAKGAVIELVKNAYDADASISVVLIDRSRHTLYIMDNGEGMTAQIIQNAWMIIGTDNKQHSYKSSSNRIRTGAKGIGRFALDRLGFYCDMITQTQSAEGVRWQVDWRQFEQTHKTIEEIKADLQMIPKLELAPIIKTILNDLNIDFFNAFQEKWQQNSGTIIKIIDLKDDWNDKLIDDLYADLENLIPPLESDFFKVYVLDAGNTQKYGLVKPPTCEDYDYRLLAQVNENQEVTLKIFRNEMDLEALKKMNFFKNSNLSKNKRFALETFENKFVEEKYTLAQLLVGYKDFDTDNNLSKIGAFDFDFYFLKRGGGQESEDTDAKKFPFRRIHYTERNQWLNRFGGIKIFRDHFRVRPYGEPNTTAFDWLNLGARALKNPVTTRAGWRVKSNQATGIIRISRVHNEYFEDKSSREGVQENHIFTLFTQIILKIIEKFEYDRNQIMIALKKLAETSDIAIERNAKADKILKAIEKRNAKNQTSIQDTEEILAAVIKEQKEDIQQLKNEQQMLRTLASTGLLVTSFAHELKNLKEKMVPRMNDLSDILHQLLDPSVVEQLPEYENPYIMLDDFKQQDQRISSWLNFTLFSTRKEKRNKKEIHLKDYLDRFKRTWDSAFRLRGIELVLKTENGAFLTGHEMDLDSILNNLVANSIDAFERKDAGDLRQIHIQIHFSDETNGINLIYEDSGPGLSKDIIEPNLIYEPFFTTKRDKITGEEIGTGLGMWIIKTILETRKAEIEFLKIRPGFKLKIYFPTYEKI